MLSLLAAHGGLRLTRRHLHRIGLASAATMPIVQSIGAVNGSGRAKHCIYIYLCGGPSQMDLWDVKPDAPEGIRTTFNPIATNVPGITFTDLIPNLARHADKLAIIRSLNHTSPDHSVGSAHTLEGRRPRGPADVYVAPTDHPALGAILHKLRGESGLVPPWVVLPRFFTTSSPPVKGQSGGFFGPGFDPVAMDEPKVDSLAAKDLKYTGFSLPDEVGRERFDGRRRLMGQTSANTMAGEERWGRISERAGAMLGGELSARAFDVTLESPKLRERYGLNEYGQSFLLARRLVESGVRFVNVFWTFFDKQGCQFNLWDNHGVATEVCGTGGVRKGADMLTHQYCTPSFDRAFPALLEDLESRGLLDDTLVVVAGEFGRTPKLNATAGRDHWPNCYTQLMAGGGVRGGQIYGESDRIGAYVKDKPVSPEDFHATVLHAFGVDSQTFIRDHLDRPIRVTEGEPVRALFS